MEMTYLSLFCFFPSFFFSLRLLLPPPPPSRPLATVTRVVPLPLLLFPLPPVLVAFNDGNKGGNVFSTFAGAAEGEGEFKAGPSEGVVDGGDEVVSVFQGSDVVHEV